MDFLTTISIFVFGLVLLNSYLHDFRIGYVADIRHDTKSFRTCLANHKITRIFTRKYEDVR